MVLPVTEKVGGDSDGLEVSMLQELSENFELVIVDAGPIFTSAYRWFEATTSQAIHGALVVRDTRATDSHQLDDVCSRLNCTGIDEVAVVENFRADDSQ